MPPKSIAGSRFATDALNRAECLAWNCTWPVPVLASVALLGLIPACTTVTPDTRPNHALEFLGEMEGQTAEALPADTTLTLDQCIALGLEHNLAARTALVEAAIARVDRQASFGDFLPKVTASANVTSWSHQPFSAIGGLIQAPMHDSTLRQYTVDVQIPIVVPATWFVYSTRRHGEAIGQLVLEQTRQLVIVQIAAKYYECLARSEEARALESQVTGAAALVEELTQLHADGLVLDWVLEQAKTALLLRQVQCKEAQGLAHQYRAELLYAMGLDPRAEITLVPESPYVPTDRPIESLIYEALLRHPALHIADRQVAIAEDNVKRAIAGFLPSIAGFSSLAGDSNSTTVPASNLYGGVAAVLTVFDGFANIQEYRAARLRSGKAGLVREERTLAIITQVMGAYLNEQLALEYARVAEQALHASESRLSAVESQAAEGLALASERLDAVAARDTAQMESTQMRYRHQLSVAMLRFAMGMPSEGQGGNPAP